MTLFRLSCILLTVIALSAGQILFKVASATLDFSSGRLLGNLLNTRLLLALLIYMVATIMWLLVLRTTPLRLAYPFAALAFFLVPILAHFLLGESIGWNTFVGAGIIAVGVAVSTFR